MNKEFLKMQKTAGLITESEYKTQLKENESVSELDDTRYSELDEMVNPMLVNNFIGAAEAIQKELANGGVDAPEMYQYLVTIMLNQA